METFLIILAVILGTAWAVTTAICAVKVLVKLFRYEGMFKGIMGIFIGPYTFIWGWINAKRLGLTKVMTVWSLMLILWFGLMLIISIVLPLLIQRPVLEDKIYLEHFCQHLEKRNFMAAMEANKADVERGSKIDPETADWKTVEELRPAMFAVANAEAVDLAIALRDTYAVSSKTGNFAAAYKEYGSVVENIAGRDWKGSTKPFDDTGSLNRVNLARLIDAATALREAAKSPKNPRLAEAYRERAERIDSLASRDWKVDEITLRAQSTTLDLEQDAISKVQSAYSIDIAAMLRDASKSHTRGKFAESYKQHAGRIESLAAKNWKTDALTKDEADALCNLLTEINVRETKR